MKMSVRQDFHFSEANKSQDLASNCIKSTNREISFKHKKKRNLAKILKKKYLLDKYPKILVLKT